MAKEKFERNKPHVNIGTIGHVDHGKTTTAAITTVYLQLVTLRKEIMVKLTQLLKKESVVLLLLQLVGMKLKQMIALVDCPGHVDYIKNMITGAYKYRLFL